MSKEHNKKLILIFTSILFIYGIIISIIEKKINFMPILGGVIFEIICIILYNILCKFNKWIQKVK